MYQLVSLRSRHVQLLIFALTCMSFYAYYYTLSSEVGLQTILSAVGHSPKTPARTTDKDANAEQRILYESHQQNTSNATSLASSSGSQVPTAVADSTSMDAKVAQLLDGDSKSSGLGVFDPTVEGNEEEEVKSESEPKSVNAKFLSSEANNLENNEVKITESKPVEAIATDPKIENTKTMETNAALESKATDSKAENGKAVNTETANENVVDPKATSAKGTDDAKKVKTVGKGVAPGIYGTSARAIYEPGHSTAIPEICPDFGADLQLLILIMSAPGNFESRTAVRQTWGSFAMRKDVAIAFFVGENTDDKIASMLGHEDNTYGDLIHGNFMDSYANLTLKTISMLEWVDSYCTEVKFVLKTDDDMFINVPRLLSFIRTHANDKNVIFGRLARKWKPIRNIKSKYFVSRVQYKPEVFPDFTTGPAYLMSSDIVPKLYRSALEQTYLKLEDVYATGIVAAKLGIKRVQANEFTNKRISFNPCAIQKSISIHMVKYSEQFDLWKKLLDGKSKCK